MPLSGSISELAIGEEESQNKVWDDHVWANGVWETGVWEGLTWYPSLQVDATLGTATASGLTADIQFVPKTENYYSYFDTDFADNGYFDPLLNANAWFDEEFATTTATAVTISATLGTATADGFTANVDKQTHVLATLGTATADGFIAQVDRQLHVTATLGIAVADGFLTNIQTASYVWDSHVWADNVWANGVWSGLFSTNLFIDATVGTAVADGLLANVDKQLTITATVGTATADGFTAQVDQQLHVTATLGTATADGFTAVVTTTAVVWESHVWDSRVWANGVWSGLISSGLNIDCTLGTAVASGLNASVQQTFGVNCTLGTAVASGFTASISSTSATITGINVSDDGTDLTVSFNTSIDLSGGWIGFAYSVNSTPPVFTEYVVGAVSSQSITVTLSELGASNGDTIYIDAGYSTTDPPSTWLWASDEGTSVYQYEVGGTGLEVNCSVGTATASGLTANVDKQLHVTATLGTAVADGLTAQVQIGLTVNCTVGTATASGYTAQVDKQLHVTGLLGTAVADGLTAQINSGLTVECLLGTAVADGLIANVDQQLNIDCLLGIARAYGFDARFGGEAVGGGIGHKRPQLVVVSIDGQDYRVRLENLESFLEAHKKEAKAPKPKVSKSKTKLKIPTKPEKIVVKSVPVEYYAQIQASVDRTNEILRKIWEGNMTRLVTEAEEEEALEIIKLMLEI